MRTRRARMRRDAETSDGGMGKEARRVVVNFRGVHVPQLFRTIRRLGAIVLGRWPLREAAGVACSERGARAQSNGDAGLAGGRRRIIRWWVDGRNRERITRGKRPQG